MIFLLRDGTYRFINNASTDAKFQKKYLKHKDKLVAVLVECFSLLHSDVYTIVLAQNFDPMVRPFDLTYTIALTSIDEPINGDTMLTRTIHIDDVHSLYNAATLIRQLSKNDDVITRLADYGSRTITLISVKLHQNGKLVTKWNAADDGDIEPFLEFNGIICDTDKFLDAAVPHSARIDMGCYYTRFDKRTGYNNLEYYYYDRKAILYMSETRWCLDVVNPRNFRNADTSERDPYFNRPDDLKRATMIRKSIREDDLCYAGLCITGTGLMYLCVLPEAVALFTMDSFEISLDVRDEKDGCLEFDTNDKWGQNYIASNYIETLYLALYIPQMLEIDRFLYSRRIRCFACEFIHRKNQSREASYTFPEKLDPDQSIDFDLLSVIAKILLTIPPTDMCV